MSFKILWDDVPEIADSEDFEQKFTIAECPEKHLTNFPQKSTHFMYEGDNYPVLKLLQKQYSQKIDFIYIDPPYNTGKKSFCYNDSLFLENKSLYLSEDRHSAWLSFMQRRLNCAKNLLSEQGVIFIAIGQEELFHLKLLCDSIFGEENFINDFMWLHGKGKKDSFSRTMQESNLCYAKNRKVLNPFIDFEITDWATSNADEDIRGPWFSGSISFDEKRSNPEHPNFFEITSPSGIKWKRQWLCSKEEMEKLLSENKIYFGKAPGYSNVPRKKIFNGEKNPIIPKNIIDQAENTRSAQNHLDEILGQKLSFDNPKPVELIKHLIQITDKKNDITVMDFFAGSGTTLEAVCQLNSEDNGKRKCILVQKPEIIQKEDSKFKTISELCYQRAKFAVEKSEQNLMFYCLKNL